jgi:hypothetical protein
VTPEIFVQRATSAFFLLVPAAIGWQILTGEIELTGLLYERDPAGRLVYSPARLQLLVVSIVAAFQFLWQFTSSPTRLSTPNQVILGLGTSQLYYLVSKAWASYQATKSLQTK